MEKHCLNLKQETISLPAPKAIIFDWDNTLVSSHAIITTAINMLFQDFDMPTLSTEEVKSGPQLSLKDSFPQIFGDRWEEARDRYVNYYRDIHLDNLDPHDGAQEVLEHLSAQNIPLFVVSNKTHSHLEAEIQALKWHTHFHFIRGSIDGQVDKPDPEAVHHALENTGIRPSKEVWFVGDSPVDVQCALNAGCLPIVLLESKNSLHFKYFQEPLVFIDNLIEIKDLLAKSK